MRILVIGAGMSGILAAIKLREAGYQNFVVYEKADRLGGTWRDNTYPGLSCDVPAHAYNYSFEPNPWWSRYYAPGAEIQAYFEQAAQKYAVDGAIRLAKEVTRCEFLAGRWRIETRDGTRDEADVVISATGVLHHPNIPEFPGLDDFDGAWFHSSRWDHSVLLDDRRIGVIGTGSTAVQLTSALVPRVRSYSLFQRTPQWIMPGANLPYTDEQKRAFAQDPGLLAAHREDRSRGLIEKLSNAVIDADSPEIKVIEEACCRNLEDNVTDPILRERLRPSYRAACKRLVLSPDFYQNIQHENAKLVTAPIDLIEPGGVRTRDGELHELDVLVLATGFQPDRFIRPTVVRGLNGMDLDEFWGEQPVAYLSISVPHFPNFFMLNGPNAPIANFPLTQIAELQMEYILRLMERLRSGRVRCLCASELATTELEGARVKASRKTIWASGCNSWYMRPDGTPTGWPWDYTRFEEAMKMPLFEAYDQFQ